MTATVIKWGDPKAQKKWGSLLAVDTIKKSYFGQKFVSTGENSVIQEKTELKDDAGDSISFDLSVQLRQKPTKGDKRLKGKEENLRFYSDEVWIDQLRHSVSAGGRMSRKRTAHDMRKIARDRLSDYWKAYIDEIKFIYLSGARGMNEDFIEDEDFEGFAKNPVEAPDSKHILFGGSATGVAEIVEADVMSKNLIERAATHAKMLRASDKDAMNLTPVDVDGKAHFCLVMSPWQAHDLRNNDKAGWLEIAKAAAAAEGRNSPIFKGGLGMVNNVVLHEHENVVRFSNYGAGQNLTAARALFLGRQAGVVAYGTPKGSRFDWMEETDDYGNEPTVAAGIIMGFKKTRYNKRDFGVIALDTFAKNPKDGEAA